MFPTEHREDWQTLLCEEKNKGNEFYKLGQLEQAIEAYSKGLRLDPTNSLLLTNRAQAFLKLNKYAECESDCTLSLTGAPLFVKSYLRRATARLALEKLEEAVRDFQRVLELEPNNKHAKMEIERLKNGKSVKNCSHDKYSHVSDGANIPTKVNQQDLSHTYGQHECQMSEGEQESNLHKLYNNCVKNPGHTRFIPLNKLSIQHLPDDYQDNELYELIKAVADLTVRVSVTLISPHRPEFFPQSSVKYPFFNMGGNVNLRSGTEQLDVLIYEEGCGYNSLGRRHGAVTGNKYDVDYKTCPCQNCQHSSKPSTIWWEVTIHTATHVVFDDIEGQHTSCRLFFDERNSPKLILDNVKVEFAHVESDRCRMKYVTCDVVLGNKLSTMTEKRTALWNKVYTKYMNKSNNRLTFIVSHPHGCIKQVSIGQWEGNFKVGSMNDNFDLTKLTYDTCTCPGSSGAHIYFVGFATSHIHNGCLDCGHNYSSVGAFRK
ncbi:RNA polymerase II-associated protein 3 X1 [Biomphalaria glabrata]|nr:RNA polymerase II-associated protein 3 X1 [Biomphalaria glabrata]